MTARPYKPTSAMALDLKVVVLVVAMPVVRMYGVFGWGGCAAWSAWAFVLEAGAVWVERQRQTAALQTWASGRSASKSRRRRRSWSCPCRCACLCVCACVVAVACDLVDESVAVAAFGEFFLSCYFLEKKSASCLLPHTITRLVHTPHTQGQRPGKTRTRA